MPVTDMSVNSMPIKKIAPKATLMLICCPSTKLNAVNAVKLMAQPIAIGTLANTPIKIEPSPATKHVAIKTDPAGKPALASIPGTTITEYTIAKNVVKPAMTSWRTVEPRSLMLKKESKDINRLILDCPKISG